MLDGNHWFRMKETEVSSLFGLLKCHVVALPFWDRATCEAELMIPGIRSLYLHKPNGVFACISIESCKVKIELGSDCACTAHR
jgi:hypothetical protein